MWQKGKTLGVVGYDHEKSDIYTAQPRWKTQKLFLEEVQAMSLQERNVNILVFLADLEYFELSPEVILLYFLIMRFYSTEVDDISISNLLIMTLEDLLVITSQ